MITKLEPSQDALLTLPEEVLQALNIKAGDKLHMEVKDDTIILSKFKTIEVELSDELFSQLALLAHEQDITLNELILTILKDLTKNHPKE